MHLNVCITSMWILTKAGFLQWPICVDFLLFCDCLNETCSPIGSFRTHGSQWVALFGKVIVFLGQGALPEEVCIGEKLSKFIDLPSSRFPPPPTPSLVCEPNVISQLPTLATCWHAILPSGTLSKNKLSSLSCSLSCHFIIETGKKLINLYKEALGMWLQVGSICHDLWADVCQFLSFLHVLSHFRIGWGFLNTPCRSQISCRPQLGFSFSDERG